MSGIFKLENLNLDDIRNVVLVLLIISAFITDLKWRRIFNTQTYGAMLLGLLYGYLSNGFAGFMFSGLGLLTGFFLLFFFYVMGGVGAGDVKLLAGIGALHGVEFVLWTMFYTALAGGFMAIAVIIWQGTFRQTMLNCWNILRHPIRSKRNELRIEHQYLPYGIAISSGCLWSILSLH